MTLLYTFKLKILSRHLYCLIFFLLAHNITIGQSILCDTLLAKFNQNDFEGIFSAGSNSFQSGLYKQGFLNTLSNLKKASGKIISVSPMKDCGQMQILKWTGEHKNLRIEILPKGNKSYDNLFISDFIEQSNNKKYPTDNPLTNSFDSIVNEYANYYMNEPNTVGLSLGIVKNNKIYTYNYGEVKKGTHQLPTANSFYELASVTKTFVATLLAQAVIEKKLKLTDDIRMYLPGKYPNLEYQGHPIRMVNLINHTSGLPDQPRTFPWDSINALSQVGVFNYFERYTKDSLFNDLHNVKLQAMPGTQFSYNGNAYHIVIAIHKPYEQILTDFFSGKLGMKETKNDLSANQLKRFVQGYSNTGQEVQHFNPKRMTGGPNLNSTISDMVKYLQANLSEINKAIKLTHQITWGNANGYALGLGWMMDNSYTCSNDRYIFHDGFSNGYSSNCSFYPDKNVGFVILANVTGNSQQLLTLQRLLFNAIEDKQ